MLSIEISTAAVEQRLDAMRELVRHFGAEDMPQELEAWQRDDMRRHFTNMETPDNVTAETSIWPRSRTFEKAHRERPLPARLLRRPGRSPPRLIGATRPQSQRPILRPELFDRLCTRMAALLTSKLTWQSTSRP